MLAEIVRGICYRDVNIVYNEGQVVETDSYHINIYHTTCGGTHGFSGVGYFVKHGKLKVIHKGIGSFLGEEDFPSDEYQEIFFNKSNTPLINSINKSYSICTNANHSDVESMKTCFSSISNKTYNTLEVRQGKYIYKINETYTLTINKELNDILQLTS